MSFGKETSKAAPRFEGTRLTLREGDDITGSAVHGDDHRLGEQVDLADRLAAEGHTPYLAPILGRLLCLNTPWLEIHMGGARSRSRVPC